ncbi:MAG: EFR1 family ferrodoxin [Lachnospiraceae bacterium]|nr:EFR1 family ferrodoxin [Lachnospiraceae bacterium]
MKIKRVVAVYYSATGNTRRVVLNLAKQISEALGVASEEMNYAPPAVREKHYTFSAEDLVLFATPVYAGRVPNKMLPFVESGFSGGDALAVPVIIFGNRNFDNGLIELRNLLEQNGFHTIAAAAVATSHVFSDVIAPGRPDEADWAVLNRFAGDVASRVKALAEYPAPVEVPGDNPPTVYYTPLGVDGKPSMFLKAKPQTHEGMCDGCGLCVEACPMAAISEEDPTQVPGTCIKCQACVKICPTEAKYFADENFLSHVKMLELNYTARKEPQVFF